MRMSVLAMDAMSPKSMPMPATTTKCCGSSGVVNCNAVQVKPAWIPSSSLPWSFSHATLKSKSKSRLKPSVVTKAAVQVLEKHFLSPNNHQRRSQRRIALFVEPSPFAYISGYKNRFENFIKYLREMGDEVIVVTTHKGVPEEFFGAKVIGSWSFPCPWYSNVPLSLALSPRIIWAVAKFKPDIIHASSPGIMVFGALFIAKLLCVPLVMSYHTHVPMAADLTLVTSTAVARELEAAKHTESGFGIRAWIRNVFIRATRTKK